MIIKTGAFIDNAEFVKNVLTKDNVFSESMFLNFETSTAYFRNVQGVVGKFNFEYELEASEERPLNAYFNGLMLLNLCRLTDNLVLEDYTFKVNGDEYKIPHDNQSNNYVESFSILFDNLTDKAVFPAKDILETIIQLKPYMSNDKFSTMGKGIQFDGESAYATNGKMLIIKNGLPETETISLGYDFIQFVAKTVKYDNQDKVTIEIKDGGNGYPMYAVVSTNLIILYPSNNSFTLPAKKVIFSLFEGEKQTVRVPFSEFYSALKGIEEFANNARIVRDQVDLTFTHNKVIIKYDNASANLFLRKELDLVSSSVANEVTCTVSLSQIMTHKSFLADGLLIVELLLGSDSKIDKVVIYNDTIESIKAMQTVLKTNDN